MSVHLSVMLAVPLADLFDNICPSLRCPPVIGKVLVDRSGSHITATCVRTMAPRLATAFAAVGVQVHYTPTG